jgi:hypothetical protein
MDLTTSLFSPKQLAMERTTISCQKRLADLLDFVMRIMPRANEATAWPSAHQEHDGFHRDNPH